MKGQNNAHQRVAKLYRSFLSPLLQLNVWKNSVMNSDL